MRDLQRLIPKDKFDSAAIERAAAAGYPAIAPILGDLLEWIQDGNWPTAGWTFRLLASVGEPVVPHIRRVLNGGDDVWKYWCLSLVEDFDRSVQQLLLPDLERLSIDPTPGEIEEGVHERARELLSAINTPAA